MKGTGQLERDKVASSGRRAAEGGPEGYIFVARSAVKK